MTWVPARIFLSSRAFPDLYWREAIFLPGLLTWHGREMRDGKHVTDCPVFDDEASARAWVEALPDQ